MSSLGYCCSGASLAKRNCASVPAQASLVSQPPGCAAAKVYPQDAVPKRSLIAFADASGRRASGYDGRSGSGRQVYEARFDDMEAEYDMPASRTNGNAQAASRGGPAQGARSQPTFSGSARTNSPPSSRQKPRARGQPDGPSAPERQMEYQVLITSADSPASRCSGTNTQSRLHTLLCRIRPRILYDGQAV